MTEAEINDITEDNPLGPPLLDLTPWSLDHLPPDLSPPSVSRLVSPDLPAFKERADQSAIEVALDARTERMLRRAVTEYRAVLLVGPPGTGKGTLLNWLVGEVHADPEEFDLRPGYNSEPLWRTPDESWTSFELIGGLAPNPDGQLVWTPGILPTAIAADRWLVLDETNRADLDKIMGPLLTWLSDQEVEVGHTATNGNLPQPVQIGWTAESSSEVDQGDAQPLRFLAGRDWRLLGTYNPQDAQLVFRFGVALSRRFAVVPIPAITRGQFEPLLESSYPKLSDDASNAIGGLYEAHLDAEATRLGPAVFLRLARYLRSNDEGSSTLAEGYVLNVGKYLASYDDSTFDALRVRVVEDQAALPVEEWEWVASHRNTLG